MNLTQNVLHYHKTEEEPAPHGTSIVVTGAGTTLVNDTYVPTGEGTGIDRTWLGEASGVELNYGGSYWRLLSGETIYYYITGDDPVGQWQQGAGAFPAPTSTWQ